MEPEKCLLCGANAVVRPQGALEQSHSVDCSICGRYSVSDSLCLFREPLPAEKEMLRPILRERALRGLPPVLMLQEESPSTSGVTVEELIAAYPGNASEMMDRALLNLGRLAKHPVDVIELESSDYPLLFGRSERDMSGMINLLTSMGYIEDAGSTLAIKCLVVSPNGWLRIEELKQANPESKQAFVAMWFDGETAPIWRDGLKPGIESAGDFVALRIDQREHNQKICDQIIAEIRRSRFVVADFTGNRGGVYYEAGFAQGLGMPVIWTVRKDWLDKVHFDTRQYNHIPYEVPSELREALKNRIMATIPAI